jgi:co-chaperonin GroES (HSP10)
MATEVKRRRGTTVEHSTFTGAVAELTVDLTKDTVVVHDGATQAGFPLLREDFTHANWTTPDGRYLNQSSNLSDLPNTSTARTNLGVAIGTDVQAYNAGLADIAGLTPTNSNFIVGDGTNWVAESGNTARTSLGLGTSDDVQFDDLTLSGVLRTNEIDTQADLVWNTSTEVWNTSDFYITGSINLAGSLYITDELDVSESVSVGTTLDVAGNTTLGGTLDVTGNTTIGGSLTLTGSADFNSTMNLQGTLTTQSDLQDDGFVATFGGAGYQIKANGDAEFGNVLVRGALSVFEFIAKQISVIGGTEVLTIATGIVESSATNQITLQMKDGTNSTSFKSNDLIRVQVVDINQNFENDGATPAQIVRSYKGQITNISGNVITTIDVDGTASSLQKGDLIVAIGNTSDTDRQSIMYRNVDRKTDKLITRVQTGINTHDGFLSVDKTRVAFGDLNGYSGLSAETFGFFAGDNSNEHALITSSGIFFKNNTTVLAQLSSNTFKVGDSTNFLSFNGSSFDIATTSFNLNTANLDISSANQNIVIGTGSALMTVGRIDLSNQGLQINTTGISNQNYWKLGQGTVQFKVGDGTNFLSFNENAGTFEIQTQAFRLDTTASGGGIDIDSTTQTIKLEDANRIRTQVDVNDGGFSLTETVHSTNDQGEVVSQGTAYTRDEIPQITKGDSILIDVSANCTSLGTGGTEAFYQVFVYGGTTSSSQTNLISTFLSNLVTTTSSPNNNAKAVFSVHSYLYNYIKVQIQLLSNATGNNAQFTLDQDIIMKSYNSQTRVSLDGVFVNNSNTQFAKLTRSANELSGIIKLTNLPTVKPNQTGVLYKTSDGTLKVS